MEHITRMFSVLSCSHACLFICYMHFMYFYNATRHFWRKFPCDVNTKIGGGILGWDLSGHCLSKYLNSLYYIRSLEAVVEFNRFTFILFCQDTSNVGSSAGWTNEKHMLYITFLEESFVNQLYSSKGEMNSAESFYGTQGARQKTSYSGDGRNTKYDQVVATSSRYYINIDLSRDV